MQFVVIKDIKTGGGAGGAFQIARLSIEAPIEQPEGQQVDITELVDQGILFQSEDQLKTYISDVFNIPVANVDLSGN
jgi:hypothetical protein